MTADKDPNDVPRADTTHWYKCDACEHLHVVLVDEDGELMATAVMSREMLVDMLKVIDDDPEMIHH